MASQIKYGAVLGTTGRRIYDFINKWYPKRDEVYVTSAYRPTDYGSHHAGQTYNGSPTAAVDYGALDFGAAIGKARMKELAAWIDANFVDLTVELIYTDQGTSGYYVKNGARVGAYAAADHWNHVHFATSAANVDKMEARAQQRWGSGTNTEPPLPTPGASVLFGWDASDFDWDRGARPEHVQAAAREGIKFFTHKLTEGTRTVHVHAGQMVDAARNAQIPYYGFYVVPRTPGNNGQGTVPEQVRFAIDEANRQFPNWRGAPGFFWQVDLEHWDYDRVAPEHGTNMVALLEQETGKQALLYAPKWSYGDTVPNDGTPLWASNYDGSGAAAKFDVQYQRAGGANHPGWGAYSGRTPRILQFSSDAITGGQHTTDANAFKGTLHDFGVMVGAGGDAPQSTGTEDSVLLGYVDGQKERYKGNGIQAAKMVSYPAYLKLKAAGVKEIKFANLGELQDGIGKLG